MPAPCSSLRSRERGGSQQQQQLARSVRRTVLWLLIVLAAAALNAAEPVPPGTDADVHPRHAGAHDAAAAGGANCSATHSACIQQAVADVGIRLAVAPAVAPLGAPLTLALDIQNFDSAPIRGPVSLGMQLPDGFGPSVQAVPLDAAAPGLSCAPAGDPGALACATDTHQALPAHSTWSYTLRVASGGAAPGPAAMAVQLAPPPAGGASAAAANVTVLLLPTCGARFQAGARCSGAAHHAVVAHRDTPLLDDTTALFDSTCCGPVDVAVSLRAGVSPALDATPNLGYVGSCIELTLDMTSLAPAAALPQASNGFVLQFASGEPATPGVYTRINPAAQPGPGAPQLACAAADGEAGPAVRCVPTADMPPGGAWRYTFSVDSGYAPGSAGAGPLGAPLTSWLATAALATRDADASNDAASAAVRLVLLTCGSSLAGGASCPAEHKFVRSATLLRDAALFASTCCGAFDAGVSVHVSPDAGPVGTQFEVAVELSNDAAVAAQGPIGFAVAVERSGSASPTNVGLLLSATPSAGPGAPGLTCARDGASLQCLPSGDLPAGATWQYTFKAQSSYTPPPEPHVDSAPVSELVTDWVVAAQLTRRDAARNNDVAHAPLRLVLMTCGAARAGGAACPAASQYVQTASNTPLGDNSPTAFNRRCCVTFDVGLSLSVTPSSGPPRTSFVFMLTMDNTGGMASEGPNGVRVALPPAAVFEGKLVPGAAGAPQLACTRDGPTVLECATRAALPAGSKWAFTFTARGGSAPEQVITAQLTKPDTNPSNDMRSAAVTVEFPTCASLLATGTRGCSRGQAALQTSGASPVSDDSQAVFDAVCCAPVTTALDVTVTPLSGPVGTTFAFTALLTNQGGVPLRAGNGFHVALAPGLAPAADSIAAAQASPGADITCAVDGATLSCTNNADLPAGSSSGYAFTAVSSAAGDHAVTVQMFGPDVSVDAAAAHSITVRVDDANAPLCDTAASCCDKATGGPRPAGTVCRVASHPCGGPDVCDGAALECPRGSGTPRPANTPCAWFNPDGGRWASLHNVDASSLQRATVDAASVAKPRSRAGMGVTPGGAATGAACQGRCSGSPPRCVLMHESAACCRAQSAKAYAEFTAQLQQSYDSGGGGGQGEGATPPPRPAISLGGDRDDADWLCWT